jgi:hypothetical protein
MSDIEAITQLTEFCEAFQERWSMEPSTLIPVDQESDEFRQVANSFGSDSTAIIQIERIENPSWSIKYFKQKQIIDAANGLQSEEKYLFHGCRYSAAEGILREGFDPNRIGQNGK